MQYYTFTVGSRPVSYYEMDERRDEIYMNARMLIEDVEQENPFDVRFESGLPTRVRLGETEWKPVPNGTYPTCAYTLVLRSGLSQYNAFVEGTGEIDSREIRNEGGLWVEYLHGQAMRKF